MWENLRLTDGLADFFWSHLQGIEVGRPATLINNIIISGTFAIVFMDILEEAFAVHFFSLLK